MKTQNKPIPLTGTSLGNGRNSAFTLVELIIVITILAILATIGFMSFQSYTLDARDSNRITSLKEISKGLEIYETKKAILPHPDEQVTTISSGITTISYQGYAGNSVLQKLKASDIKDPKDNNYYTYIVNSDKTKYQLLSLLENGTSIQSTSYNNNLVNTTYARTYTDRFMYTVGDKVGVFVDNTTKSPVQETLTGINLQTSTTTYKVVFANTSSNSGVIVSSGASLYNNIIAISNTVISNVNQVKIVTYNTGKRFEDGTYAISCNGYRNPTSPYTYDGVTGDGVYTIDPDGNGGNVPFDVYCDMITDDGGWTLVYKVGGNVATENAAGMNTDKNLANLVNLTLNTSTALSHYNFSRFNSIGNNWIIRSYSDCTNTGNDFCQKLYLKPRVGLEENIGTALSRKYNDSSSRLQVATRYSSQTYQGLVYQDVPISDTDYGVGFYTRHGSRLGECNTSTSSIGITTMSNCHAFFAFGRSASTGLITWAFGTPSHTWTRNGIVWLK